MELNQLYPVIIGIMLVGLILGVGLFILGQVQSTGLSFETDEEGNQTILMSSESTTTVSPIGTGTNVTGSSATTPTNSWLTFDGVNDRIDISERFCEGTTNNLSISSWVYIRNSTSTNRFIARLCGEGNSRSPYLGLDETGNLSFQIRNATDNTVSAVNPNSTILNNWYHVVGVYNSTNVIIYIDSILKDIDSQTGFIKNSTGKPTIGYSTDSGDNYFDGALDEIRIYNRSLSQTEVNEIYNSGMNANSSLPSDNLVGWYSFDEASGTVVHDKSGNGNHGS